MKLQEGVFRVLEGDISPLQQKLINYFGIVVLAVFAAFSGYVSLSALGSAFKHFSSPIPEVIVFNRGFVMSLGAFITISALLVASIMHEFKALISNPKLIKIIMRLAISGIALLIILGFLSQYFYDGYFLENKGYEVCEEASSQWLFLKTTVYAEAIELCPNQLN